MAAEAEHRQQMEASYQPLEENISAAERAEKQKRIGHSQHQQNGRRRIPHYLDQHAVSVLQEYISFSCFPVILLG